MFRKFLIAAMFATAAGYCFAAENLPQVVTSEVFYTENKAVVENTDNNVRETEYEYVQAQPEQPVVVPAWPLTGTDADMEVSCEGSATGCTSGNGDNIKIVSKIGADLVVENNFNLGGVRGDFNGWSGGANMLHGLQLPAGFDDECNTNSEMPLLHREMLEDDGGEVLAASRSGRKRCGAGFANNNYSGKIVIAGENGAGDSVLGENGEEILVDQSADAEAPKAIPDQVRSWVVASGQSLREVLQNWCDKEGWDLVWATSREYPIEASAVFKGRFVDVSSALVRNFGRATPVPYAKFYKGNRVLVVSTTEE